MGVFVDTGVDVLFDGWGVFEGVGVGVADEDCFGLDDGLGRKIGVEVGVCEILATFLETAGNGDDDMEASGEKASTT